MSVGRDSVPGTSVGDRLADVGAKGGVTSKNPSMAGVAVCSDHPYTGIEWMPSSFQRCVTTYGG